MKTLAEELATFAADLRLADLPLPVVEHIRLHVLDIIGVCLLSTTMPHAPVLRRIARRSGGVPESTLVRGDDGPKLPAELAALHNSALAHSSEFDDTYGPGRWHGSAPTVPPTLAVGEAVGASGERIVTALAAGLEIGCRLTRAAPQLMDQGFHSTCTAGVFAATLSVSRLLELSPNGIRDALGIAGSFASGNMEYLNDPDPWTKCLQVGHAASAGILAARAAAEGFSGPRAILEGRYGYFRSYAREGNFDLDSITKELGSTWELLRLYPKRYPCEHVAQGYIDCVLALRRQEPSLPEGAAGVECVVHPRVIRSMFEPRSLRLDPPNGWSARWSMPFTVAVALVDGEVTVDSFRDERVADPRVKALMPLVTYVADGSLNFPDDYPAWVRMRMKDGRLLEHKVLKVAGGPENPLPAAEYEDKFLRNAQPSLGSQRTDALMALLRSLPVLEDVSTIASHYG